MFFNIFLQTKKASRAKRRKLQRQVAKSEEERKGPSIIKSLCFFRNSSGIERVENCFINLSLSILSSSSEFSFCFSVCLLFSFSLFLCLVNCNLLLSSACLSLSLLLRFSLNTLFLTCVYLIGRCDVLTTTILSLTFSNTI